ncbi:MAG: hypothetical protein ACYC25_10635 [Paludibacter sp.]
MKTNFYSLNFWILTPALLLQFLTIQIPNISRFGFWGIIGTALIYSVIPIILWALSIKYKKKGDYTNNSTQRLIGYFFTVITILFSLFYVLASFGALIGSR